MQTSTLLNVLETLTDTGQHFLFQGRLVKFGIYGDNRFRVMVPAKEDNMNIWKVDLTTSFFDIAKSADEIELNTHGK